MGDVEPVLAAEREVQVVADDAAHLLRVELEEAADAVVLVHDVVARLQVAEARPGRAQPAGAASGAAAEELGRGQQREAQHRRDEAVAERADDEADARLARPGAPRRQQLGLHPVQRHAGALRLAHVREADEHPVAGPDERAQLVLGLGDAERRQRRRLGVELNGWPSGISSSTPTASSSAATSAART